MASLGKLTASLATGTAALLNVNFDFSLYKIEAPKEFEGVGSHLSLAKRKIAESGSLHITARKLGALFERLIPPIPELTKAYGTRASEIAASFKVNPTDAASSGAFASHLGPDATSIWAAATSGKHAIATHLLACLLARIWEGPEATSIWAEITEKRKAEIIQQFDQNDVGDLGVMTAAKETFSRSDLADWDASARAWLRAADSVNLKQQKQVQLIVDNIRIPVNHISAVYESVLEAWKSSLMQMEKLLQGTPQPAYNGSILLALTSWHLYPDMIVLQDKSVEIHQQDPLFTRGNGRGILTVGLEQPQTKNNSEGIFWSLPLAHLRYYGHPVKTLRSIGSSERSRITVDQLWQATLASYLRVWDNGDNTKRLYRSFADVADMLVEAFSAPCRCQKDAHCKNFSWLALLSAAAKRHLDADNENVLLADKLHYLGRTYGPFSASTPLFGFISLSNLINVSEMSHDQLIKIIRTAATKMNCEEDDLLIRYKRFYPLSGVTAYEYATATSRLTLGMKRKFDYAYAGSRRHRRWLRRPKNGQEDPRRSPILAPRRSMRAEISPVWESQWDDPVITGFWGEEPISPVYQPVNQPVKHVSSVTKLQEDLEIRKEQLVNEGEDVDFFDEDFEESKTQDVLRCRQYTVKHTFFHLMGDRDTLQVFYAVREYSLPNKGSHTDPTLVEEMEDNLKVDDWLTDAYVISQGLTAMRSAMDQQGQQLIAWFTPGHVQTQECARIFAKEVSEIKQSRQTNVAQEVLNSLCALSTLSKFASTLEDMTLDVRVVRQHLGTSPWYEAAKSLYESLSSSLAFSHPCNSNSTFPDPLYMSLSQCFACVTMLETGRFNLYPHQLELVVALSCEDSLYVATSLLSDPWETSGGTQIKRVVGNIGRAGLAFIVPPANPMVLEMDIDHWYQINHSKFDGSLSNCFEQTALQLSFTEAVFPIDVDVGSIGGRDIEAYFMEALISVYERGKWIADLDILNALNSQHFRRLDCCGNLERNNADSSLTIKLFSIDTFAELLMPLPQGVGIIRAHKNWQARLAAATLSIIKGYQTMVLPPEFCWDCLRIQLENAEMLIS